MSASPAPPALDLDALHAAVVRDARAGRRARRPLSGEEARGLGEAWGRALDRGDTGTAEKALCVLGAAQDPLDGLEGLFVRTLESAAGGEGGADRARARLAVLALGASWRHVIDRSHRTGERIGHGFLEALRGLLAHPDPEVLEWTLRTVDQADAQALPLKDAVAGIRIGFWGRLLDRRLRACSRIVAMLRRRWGARRGAGPPKKTAQVGRGGYRLVEWGDDTKSEP